MAKDGNKIKKAFAVVENYQQHDGEGYRYWKEEKIRCYRVSKQGVDEAISELIKEAHKKHMETYMQLAANMRGDWSKTTRKIMDNKVMLISGMSDSEQEYDLFFAREIEILP